MMEKIKIGKFYGMSINGKTIVPPIYQSIANNKLFDMCMISFINENIMIHMTTSKYGTELFISDIKWLKK